MPSPPWDDDFISAFMAYTEGAFSPTVFRLWSAIAMVAGGLERRVWAKVGPPRTYPNLYILLVAAPGIGKQVIDITRGLWKEANEPGTKIRAFHVAPHQMTKASLIDSLAKAKRSRLCPDGLLTYHSLLVAAEEFQVLLPNYDTEYISALNYMFNSPDMPYEEVRRTGSVKDLAIDMPQLNILAGVQPSYFVSTFPEEAWTTGFARRIIMVYAHETPFRELFEEEEHNAELRAKLTSRLGQMSALYGQCLWDPEAMVRIKNWHRAKGPPKPEHSKLAHYNNSRTMLLVKLCIVSAISATGQLLIMDSDVKRALGWLLEAERVMPDIFREMIGKSDSQVLEELHYFVTALWAKDKQKPVRGDLVRKFLLQRIPHEKVESLIMVAERANILARVAGTQDLWLPRPKHEHGME